MININLIKLDNHSIVIDTDVLEFKNIVQSKFSLKKSSEIKTYLNWNNVSGNRFSLRNNEDVFNTKNLINLLNEYSQYYHFTVDKSVQEWINQNYININSYLKLGSSIKNNCENDQYGFNRFKNEINLIFKTRKLKDTQFINAYFAFKMEKSCNFSVPGSGKTTTILAAYAYANKLGMANKIVVVGPKSCFRAWKEEYLLCFGKSPMELNMDWYKQHTFKWNMEQKKSYINVNNIILVNYEAVKKYHNELNEIIDNKTFLVFDESHKIKNPKGQYATMAMSIAKKSKFTVLLTGTPIPNSFSDIYTSLKIMHPYQYSEFWCYSPEEMNRFSERDIDEFNKKFNPFFVRVTKNQLNIPPPEPDEIIKYKLSPIEENLLNEIIIHYQKVKEKSSSFEICIRLLQSLIMPKMICKSIYDSIELKDNSEILDSDEWEISESDVKASSFMEWENANKINNLINQIKTTTKMKLVIDKILELYRSGKKVLVWSIFVDTMYEILKQVKLRNNEISCGVINGKVSLEEREKIIDSFKRNEFSINQESDEIVDVLIASPHTMAESVSLHDVCHDCIYVDFSYNLVHLIQSRDRIHRLGISQNQYTKYTFFMLEMSKHNIESMIYDRLKEKEEHMYRVINSDTLNIDTEIDAQAITDEIVEKVLSNK